MKVLNSLVLIECHLRRMSKVRYNEHQMLVLAELMSSD